MSFVHRVKLSYLAVICILLLTACRLEIQPIARDLPVRTGWRLVFQDEFDGPALDLSKWNTCYWWAVPSGCTNSGNRELEWYQPDDVLVEDGVLRLRAQDRIVHGYPYSSGMISGHDKFSFLYGYVEARLKSPRGRGLWPALWMLPVNHEWPPEIDILEILGHAPETAHMTLHYKLPSSPHLSQGSSYSGPDFSKDWHIFSLHWEPGVLTWYIDGEERFTLEHDVPDVPMYLIANLAVGGNWPGSPDETTFFPAYFEIDYIRVYQNPEYVATAVLPTPTPSGGRNILHAKALRLTDRDGKDVDSVEAGKLVFWRVQVVNQDGWPVRNATVEVELVDSKGNVVERMTSLSVSDRQGWVKSFYHVPLELSGKFALRIRKISLYLQPEATHDASADAKPLKFKVIP